MSATDETVRLLTALFTMTPGEREPVKWELMPMVALHMTVIQFAIIWITRLVMIEPCATMLMRPKHKTQTPASKKRLRAKVEKFAQSTMVYEVWQFVFLLTLLSRFCRRC